ncbi:hypothetical protein [Belliella pelovolcani]|uniref:hypothetical protein n=1 Tax=Belliella pelovolcani TaxID=529505 RepID=UPI00391D5496
MEQKVKINTRYEVEKLILKDGIQTCHNKLNNIHNLTEDEKKELHSRIERLKQEHADLMEGKILSDLEIKKVQNQNHL